jgi:hypothetical protein
MMVLSALDSARGRMRPVQAHVDASQISQAFLGDLERGSRE